MIEEDAEQKRRSIPESEQQLVEKPIIGDVKKANGKLVVDMEKTQKKIKQISEQKDSENQARGSLSKRESHDFKGNSPYKILVEKPIIGDVKKANGKLVVDMEKTQKKIKQISEQKDSENQARGSLSKRESHDFKGNSPYKIVHEEEIQC
ncbi:hypothetical protein F2Q70_00034489 [Brassica cretica]|uniref:Uncharacterized protein n=1 Tax=Brassica cretica TaxID=69181 RepID=A0A8S9JPF8_BRACR|nr:hypothetical protein F2Q70_00034489 [Brassica cretica]